MAKKRMFCKSVLEEADFLKLSPGAKVLYFYLCMDADDDGFVDSPDKVARIVRARGRVLAELWQSKYVIVFTDGTLLVTHWLLHNTIRKDTYEPTRHQKNLSTVRISEDKTYELRNETVTDTLQNRNEAVTQPLRARNETVTEPSHSIDKNRLDKKKKNNKKEKDISERKIPTLEEIKNYIVSENVINVIPEKFFGYYQKTDWMKNGQDVSKSWQQKIHEWSLRNAQGTGAKRPTATADDGPIPYDDSQITPEMIAAYEKDRKEGKAKYDRLYGSHTV